MVWFGISSKQWGPQTYLSSAKRRAGMASIVLVWFGISFKQWRPLTYLSSVRRRVGMASIDLVWFGGISSNHWRPLTYLSSAKRRAGMASIVLFWFGISFKQWRPLTYLSSVRRRVGMASIDLVWFGWYFLQPLKTSDLPLLGEKKNRDGEHWFGLVWFVFPPSNDDLWLTSPRWEEEPGWRGLCITFFIDLVWFSIFSKQWRPLTYLFSVRRRAGMASIDLVWFGLVFPPSNDDLWLTSPRWEEELGWRGLLSPRGRSWPRQTQCWGCRRETRRSFRQGCSSRKNRKKLGEKSKKKTNAFVSLE